MDPASLPLEGDKPPIRILVGHSQVLFSEALSEALDLQDDIEATAVQTGNGVRTLEACIAAKPSVAVVDYWLWGMEGPAVTRMLGQRSRRTKVILLSWMIDSEQVHQAAWAGAVALLPMTLEVKDLTLVIRRVEAGGHPLREQDSGQIKKPHPADEEVWRGLVTLTPREVEMLGLLSFGPVEQVARVLSVSSRTVQNRLYRIMKKMPAASQIEAISIARRFGLIEK